MVDNSHFGPFYRRKEVTSISCFLEQKKQQESLMKKYLEKMWGIVGKYISLPKITFLYINKYVR